jgi:hypothetical protein
VQALRKKWWQYDWKDESWDDYFNRKVKREIDDMEYAKKMYNMYKGLEKKIKWWMVTIRPKYEDTSFEVFKEHVEFYVSELPYINLEYAFEQKGESLEDLGKGFHVHIIFSTEKVNYWQSHILRDIKRKKYKFLEYTKANCIQVDSIVCLQRAQEYIRGIKNDDAKELSCSFDEEWRKSLGIVSVVSDTREN